MGIDCGLRRMYNSLSPCRLVLSLAVQLIVVTFVISEVASLSYNSFGSVLKDDLLSAPVSQNQDPNSSKKGYWCDYCSVGFNKRKSLIEHLNGKRHKAVVADGDAVWEDYVELGNRGASPSVFFDESVTKIDVARAWSLDKFMEGLRARSRSSKAKFVASGMVGTPGASPSSSHTGNNFQGGAGNQIDPRLRLHDLPPSKRAALFRYLHASSSGIPGLIDMVSALPPKYVRVKELLESVEVYFQVVDALLKRSTEQGQKPKRLTRVYDIGCGHGLVGMLIAASYPSIEVRSIDLVPRESFLAQRDAFASTGTSMDNLVFRTGDLSAIAEMEDERVGGGEKHTLVLCVHGCKELTHESIELARDRGMAWLALPCCLRAGDHLEHPGCLRLGSDHTRYALLCGALAGRYHPETVAAIDSRITGRGIVLASSGGGD
uniref:C2H2-type domain-containing protein n=1 Tax=Pseudo-nitzschia multistriata TaxID=183589 RepID=A0A448ZB42_9STRA